MAIGLNDDDLPIEDLDTDDIYFGGTDLDDEEPEEEDTYPELFDEEDY